MLIACLWSHWRGKGEPNLLSFAAVTDDPPEEPSLAGHDRCIIPIKHEHIDARPNPDPSNLAAQYAVLDDRNRPYYEYQNPKDDGRSISGRVTMSIISLASAFDALQA